MSADNYYIVKRHPLGGYAAVMGFASDDRDPVARRRHAAYPTIREALDYAHRQYSEYGVSVDSSCAADYEQERLADLFRDTPTEVLLAELKRRGERVAEESLPQQGAHKETDG